MARAAHKRGTAKAEIEETEVDSPANTALDDIEDEMEESMAVDLQTALAECGDTGQVRIQVIKIAPKDEAGACTTYDSAELSIDRVREEYGAGTFHLMFRNPKGQLLTRKRLSIVGKKQEPVKPATTADLAKLLEGGNATGQSNNMMLMLMKMMEMQGAQMVAMLSRPAPVVPTAPPMGPQEIIAMMTGLASIMKPATPAESPMDAMLKGVKLAKDLSGDGDGDSFMGLVSKGLDVIPGLMQGNAAQAQAIPPTARAVEVRQLSPSPPVAEIRPTFQGSTPEENDMFAKVVWLKGRVAYLLEKARANKDPALYADLFLDELPDFITQAEIRERMSTPEWYTQLCQLNRACEQFEEWFNEFHDALAERFAEADLEQAVTSAPSINGADAQSVANTDDETTPLN